MKANQFTLEQQRLRDANASALLASHSTPMDLVRRGAAASDGAAIRHLRSALDDAAPTIAYGELPALVSAFGAQLRARGIGPTDVVALLVPPSTGAVIAQLAAMEYAVAMPLNLLLTPASIYAQLKHVGAKALLIPPPDDPSGLHQHAQAARREVPSLTQLIEIPTDGTVPFSDARSGRFPAAEPAPGVPTRVAALLSTGGTTGAPKVARLTNGSIVAASIAAMLGMDLSRKDRVLMGMPLFHVGGLTCMTLPALAAGAELVVATNNGYRDKGMQCEFWRVVDRHRINATLMISTSLSAISHSSSPAGYDISCLRYVGHGNVAHTAEIERRFLGIWPGDAARQVYGMTEYSGIIAQVPLALLPVPGAVGPVVPLTKLALLINGEIKTHPQPDEVGELLVKGPQVFAGYTDAALTDSAFLDGWLKSGDLCRIDEYGQLHVVGRAKDLIRRSGHNIDPATIESAAAGHPAVEFVAAVARPDPQAGELPTLYVTLRPGSDVDAHDLAEFIKGRIAEPPARPRHITVLETMPTTAIGKIFKPRLREWAARDVAMEALAAGSLVAHAVSAEIHPKRGLVVTVEVAEDKARAAAEVLLAPFPFEHEVRLKN